MLGRILRQLLAGRATTPDPVDRIKAAYAELTAERHERARDLAREILLDVPDSHAARLLLAQACASLGEMATALSEADAAIASAPGNAEGYLVRGMIHEAGSRVQAALADYDRALALDPAQLAALDRKGTLHDARGEFEDSLACAEQLIAMDPGNADNHHKHAITLRELGRLADAEAALRRALDRAPGHPTARAHLGLVLIETGRFDAAAAILDPLLAAAPEHVEGRWSAAVLHLLHGRWDPGWTCYEARESRRDPTLRVAGIPEWDGRPLADGALLVNAEQGLGDQIMFASCLPDLLAVVPNCVLSCEPRLRPLLQRSFPDVRVIDMRQAPALTAAELPLPVRAQTMLGSLPGRYRRHRDQFRRHDGYLRPDPAAVDAWKQRLQALGPGLKIGLSWTGGTAKTRRNLRSIGLDRLEPLLTVPGCRFVSLQYVDSRREIDAMRRDRGLDLAEFPEVLHDYEGTAALVGALDLVITVCTAIAHLSGAQGRPVWIMAPAVPEWRYQLQGEDMPWYPSARIWRQRSYDGWDEVIGQVAAALDRHVRAQGNAGG